MNINLPLFGSEMNKKKHGTKGERRQNKNIFYWQALCYVRAYFHFLIFIIDQSSFIATTIIEKNAYGEKRRVANEIKENAITITTFSSRTTKKYTSWNI